MRTANLFLSFALVLPFAADARVASAFTPGELAEREGSLLHRQVQLGKLEVFSVVENAWRPYVLPPAKLYVVNLWSVHCIPCLEEFPKLKQLVDGWQTNQEVRFLFIADPPGDSSSQEIASFWQRHLDKLPTVRPMRTTTEELRHSLEVDSQPITLLVDANGTIRQALIGTVSKRNVGAAIERLWRALQATPAQLRKRLRPAPSSK